MPLSKIPYPRFVYSVVCLTFLILLLCNQPIKEEPKVWVISKDTPTFEAALLEVRPGDRIVAKDGFIFFFETIQSCKDRSTKELFFFKLTEGKYVIGCRHDKKVIVLEHPQFANSLDNKKVELARLTSQPKEIRGGGDRRGVGLWDYGSGPTLEKFILSSQPLLRSWF